MTSSKTLMSLLGRVRSASRAVGRDGYAAARAVTKAMARPSTYPGYLKESLALAASTAMWPVGVVSEALKLDDGFGLGGRRQLPLRYLDPLAASTPIVLVHGTFHNRSGFVIMKRMLSRFGFRYVDTMNYNVIGHDVAQLAAQLAVHVEAVCEQTGAEKVHLVGHSLGGIVSRYYVQVLEGHHRVHTCITLGSPHQGTYAAWISRAKAVRQLRPDSELYETLARAHKPPDVRFVAFYSNLDGLVLPPSNAKLVDPDLHAHNILVKDLGHLSLLVSRPLIRSVAGVLSTLDDEQAVRDASARARA